MPNPSPLAGLITGWLASLWLPWLGMAVVGGVMGALGLAVAEGETGIALGSIGLTLFCAGLFRLGVQGWRSLSRHWAGAQLRSLLAGDFSACIATTAEGRVLFANPAGERRLDGALTLTAMLEGLFAHPGAVLYRMQSGAANGRPQREDLTTHLGQFRLSVYCPAHDLYLWRLEQQHERVGLAKGPDGISLPMLIVSEGGTVLFANEAIRRLLGSRPKRLDRVILDHPVQSGAEVTIPAAAGLIRATALEILGGG